MAVVSMLVASGLDYVLSFISHLPGAVTVFPPITTLTVFCLYIIIICIMETVKSQIKKFDVQCGNMLQYLGEIEMRWSILINYQGWYINYHSNLMESSSINENKCRNIWKLSKNNITLQMKALPRKICENQELHQFKSSLVFVLVESGRWIALILFVYWVSYT